MKIAICGKMRSGKDTLGDMLVNDYEFEAFKFSSGITDLINTYFPEVKETRKSRHHYQHIGQFMRELNPNIWVDHTFKQIEDYQASNLQEVDVVITDLRQRNEYKKVDKEGFITIKVEADEDIRISRAMKANDLFDMGTLRHDTELQVDDIPADITITNNGTLEEFEASVNKALLALFEAVFYCFLHNDSDYMDRVAHTLKGEKNIKLL